MKTLILTSILSLLFYSGCAQNFGFYNGRLIPSINKKKLRDAKFIMDIAPDLWHRLALPYHDYAELDDRRKTQGYYNDNTFVDYVMVEISTTTNGKIYTSQSSTDKLTTEQKNILLKADLGSDIQINIKFKYKIAVDNKIMQGKLTVEVVPEIEAEFPGRVEERIYYFSENLTKQLSNPQDLDKLGSAIVVFTINEAGQVTNVKIVRTSTDAKIDKLLLNVIGKMPKWIPAKDSTGKKVKQTFKIAMGGGC